MGEGMVNVLAMVSIEHETISNDVDFNKIYV